MVEFKESDIVYHKATLQKGVIAAKAEHMGWLVAWADGKRTVHTEAELYTEEEYKKKRKEENPNEEGSGGSFMSA